MAPKSHKRKTTESQPTLDDCATSVKRKKDGMTAEEVLAVAFGMDGSAFLSFFETRHREVAANYRKLAQEQGVIDEYKANALLTILSNEPRCCYGIARTYVEQQTGPTTKSDE